MATSPTRNNDTLEAWRSWSQSVISASSGRWDSLLHKLAPSIHAALERPGRHIPCPQHGGKDGFRVMRDVSACGRAHCNTCGAFPDGISLLRWANGWTYREALNEVAEELNMKWDAKSSRVAPRAVTPPPIRQKSPEELEAQRRKDVDILKNMDKLVDASDDINWAGDNPATRYFRHRGLEAVFDDPPFDLRLHPALDYWSEADLLDASGAPVRDGKGRVRTHFVKLGRWPAILAMVRAPDGEIIGVHRIWVTEEGHKPFAKWTGDDPAPDHKRLAMLPSKLTIKGAAVRLYNAGPSIGLGEGIETVLGARAMMMMRQQGRKLPVWAGISAGGLELIEVPPISTDVIIFSDNDRPGTGIRRGGDRPVVGRGEEASRVLRDRLLDRGGARIFMPPRVDSDWLDVYNAYRRHLTQINKRYAPVYMTEDQLMHSEMQSIESDLGGADHPIEHEPAIDVDADSEDLSRELEDALDVARLDRDLPLNPEAETGDLNRPDLHQPSAASLTVANITGSRPGNKPRYIARYDGPPIAMS